MDTPKCKRIINKFYEIGRIIKEGKIINPLTNVDCNHLLTKEGKIEFYAYDNYHSTWRKEDVKDFLLS